MKKIIIYVLAAVLVFSLCACGNENGTAAVSDGRTVSAGELMTASVPDGFVINESNDALSFSGIYYFTFTSGEGISITNSEGEEATVYSCQIYLLAAQCGGLDYAVSSIAQWKALESESYETEETAFTANDGSIYDCLLLTPKKEDSPFSAGAAAFLARENLAVSAEIYCREDFDGDIVQILQQLADGFAFTQQEN